MTPPSQPSPRPRWPYAGPPQKALLAASIAVTVAAFLPWLMTGVGNFTGMGGAGTWTVFAGVAGIGASLMRRPRLVALHAAVLALLAIGLPVWQLLHVLSRVGFGGWLPGAGLLVTLAGGLVAARAAAQLVGLLPPSGPRPATSGD